MEAETPHAACSSGYETAPSPSVEQEIAATTWPIRRLGSRGRGRGRLRHQFADALRHLGALRYPVLDAFPLQIDMRGCTPGIVGSDYLDRAAIPCPFFLNDHHAILRLFARTCARETNH